MQVKTLPRKVVAIPKAPAISAAKRRAIADEYGAVDEAYQPLKKRRDFLQAQILGLHADLAADLGTVEEGDVYTIEIPPKGNERKVTALDKLVKFLGLKKFLSFAKFNVGDLEESVPAESRGLFLVEARTGGRRMKAIRKFVPAEAA